MSPGNNTGRPAAGPNSGVQGEFGGDHALAKGRAPAEKIMYWSLGRASGGLGGSGGRRGATAV